jgi:hypothetical protein
MKALLSNLRTKCQHCQPEPRQTGYLHRVISRPVLQACPGSQPQKLLGFALASCQQDGDAETGQRANPTYRLCAPSSSLLPFWKPGGACFVGRPCLRVVFERRRRFRQQKNPSQVECQCRRERQKFLGGRSPARQDLAIDKITRWGLAISPSYRMVGQSRQAADAQELTCSSLLNSSTLTRILPHLAKDSSRLGLVILFTYGQIGLNFWLSLS